jgi:hypothetical protein
MTTMSMTTPTTTLTTMPMTPTAFKSFRCTEDIRGTIVWGLIFFSEARHLKILALETKIAGLLTWGSAQHQEG